MMANADIWEPMSNAPLETPLYVRVYVDDAEMTKGLEVAAFIDEQCRAQATSTTSLNAGGEAYLLRVNGTDADQNKTITIKAFYNNLVYRFTTTQIFDGETSTHEIPLVLYLNSVIGVTLTNPINIVAALPYERDLKNDVTVNYFSGAHNGTSTLESELTYSWTTDATADVLTVGAQTGVLNATGETLAGPANVNLTVTGPNYGGNAGPSFYSAVANAIVTVTEPVVPVESITLNPTTISAAIGENYLEKIESAGVAVTVLPANASDKTYTTTPAPESAAKINADNIITDFGELTIVFTSNSNPAVKANLTINVPQPVSFNFPAEVVLSKLYSTPVAFTNLAGDGFDKNLITVTFSNASGDVPCATASMADATGMNWTFDGKYVGTYTYRVLYNGNPMTTETGAPTGTVRIPAEVALNNTGWDWISLYSYSLGNTGPTAYALKSGENYLPWMNLNANNKIIEIRSQTALLYNDPQWGFIGDITEISPAGGMYKVKAMYDDANMCIISTGSDCVPITSTPGGAYNFIRTGYTWISYPLETATTIGQTQLAATAQEGDMLIGKTTTATYDGTKWLPADFALLPGKGYIYYTEGNGNFTPNFSAPPANARPRLMSAKREKALEEPCPWTYDAGQFADNMPVIATLDGVDTPEDYIIGAFVGEECRGEGRAVEDNVFIINVAGKGGEQVKLRIYHKPTAESTAADASVTYSSKVGSLRAPLRLKATEATAIESVSNEPFTMDNESAWYTLDGRMLNALPTKRGIYIHQGKKVIR